MTSHCIVLSVFATMERLQLLLLLWLKRRRNRRYWVHPIFQLRETFGEYHHLMQPVLSDDEKCLAYIRMRPDTFKTLLEMIGPHIEKRTTNFRKPLPATERLVITLRYLASEDTHQSQSFHFRAGISTVRITDASGKFVVVDVGSCGGNSDGGVLSRSSLDKKLMSDKLSIPQRGYIPGTDIELPYMFVADEAFPLRENIMKPFPHRQLATEKEIFNYRLSRARNSVECSFGRLAQMWRILFRQIDE
ncbi:hypothetical protein RRG08_058116 [Elysia crispata]|uniref:DDE Tnp4 domain-containing protein n=1 Tax=Elysia crispata TaxID=231223 RepID=A0AAE0Y2X1_9GAST|nr:hypothetical protein RRG08_058116 [Elysia crispata]